MKFKFYLITAALALALIVCAIINGPLNVKTDEVLSKTDGNELSADVNNDLHGENSVENVENSTENPEPPVENSSDSTNPNNKNDENHTSVKDSTRSENVFIF